MIWHEHTINYPTGLLSELSDQANHYDAGHCSVQKTHACVPKAANVHLCDVQTECRTTLKLAARHHVSLLL